MIIKHYSGANTPKPRFFIFFDYSERSKNHRVFSLYMQGYSTKQGIVHFNVDDDAPPLKVMTEE